MCVCYRCFNLQSESPHWILTPFSGVRGPKSCILEEERRDDGTFLLPLKVVADTNFHLHSASALFLWHSFAVAIRIKWKPTLALAGLFSILLTGSCLLEIYSVFLKKQINFLFACLSCGSYLSDNCSVINCFSYTCLTLLNALPSSQLYSLVSAWINHVV